MHVFVACEFSGTVRDAFASRGHRAWSCDLLPSDLGDDDPWHIQDDYRNAIELAELCGPIDLIIGHPPCTAISITGNRWYTGTPERAAAVQFVRNMAYVFERHARVGWAIENPVGVLSTQWRRPTQYIQPWQFGHGEQKKTGLWLSDGLAPLTPTNIVDGREQRVWKMGETADRWKKRSKTYAGVAAAMAEQWGDQEEGKL